MTRGIPFESDELDNMRREQRELLISIDARHLAETLDARRVRQVQLPDDIESAYWAGAELQARQAVDRLLAQDETAAYANASRGRHAADVFYRAVQLIEPLEFSDRWTGDAVEGRQRAARVYEDAVSGLERPRLLIGALIEALVLAEIVSTDDWDFPPVRDVLNAGG